jgi:hypothetical protein
MYSADQLKKAIQNPRIVLYEVWGRVLNQHDRIMRQTLGREGIDIMSQDWDNLIVLDGCRHDMFADCCEISGEYDTVLSGGSSTREWLRYNFDGREFADTVYVSANAQAERFGMLESFYNSERLWLDDWDDDLFTVRPEVVADRTIEAEEKYTEKRLISHWVQPHYPFIGEKGQEIDHKGFSLGGEVEEATEHKNIWKKLRDGEIDKDTVWEAYVENLEITMPHVERVCDELEGKTVVTADHGNALGEWGIYGHPHNRFIESLVEVPWFVADFEGRKQTAEGNMSEENKTSGTEDDVIEDRLQALGYKT